MIISYSSTNRLLFVTSRTNDISSTQSTIETSAFSVCMTPYFQWVTYPHLPTTLPTINSTNSTFRLIISSMKRFHPCHLMIYLPSIHSKTSSAFTAAPTRVLTKTIHPVNSMHTFHFLLRIWKLLSDSAPFFQPHFNQSQPAPTIVTGTFSPITRRASFSFIITHLLIRYDEILW